MTTSDDTNSSRSHIFISYARDDGSEQAARLQTELEALGYDCWRDTRDLNRTQDFTVEIEKEIEDHATHVVVCVTPGAKQSTWVRREIAYAELCGLPITPLMLADIKPPLPLVNLTWVEQHKIGWHAALKQVGTSIQQAEVAPVKSDDPFREYLQTLYQAIVTDLDRRVIKQIDLHSKARPDAIKENKTYPDEVADKARQEINLSFFGRGLSIRKVEEAPIPETAHDGKFDTFSAAFEHYDGRVLLLGEPGAGKTTTLMAYARDAVARRLDDPNQPLPVMAILSAWPSHEPPPLSEWLAGMVEHIEGIEAQIKTGKALLLLDGLDELGSSREDKNKQTYDPRQRFLEHIPDNNRILITCRIRDYEQIGDKAALNGAVTLQPLTIEQMQNYLTNYPNLWTAIESDDTLREICTTPLLLSIFAYGFQESTEAERQVLQSLADSPAELRDRIFGMYVERRYEHERLRAEYMGETLPFTLEKIYKILGKALEKRLNNFFVKDTSMIVAENLLTEQIELITSLCCHLRYLTPIENEETDEIGWRFAHSLLRTHFGFPVLVKCLSDDENSEVRRKIVDALGEIGDDRAIEVLISCLDDTNWKIRHSACESLVKLGWEPQTLEQQISYIIARQSWRECIQIGIPIIPSLVNLLTDEDWHIRYGAATTIGKLGDKRAIPPLIDCLNDASWEVRRAAIKALGSLGVASAVPKLMLHLSNTSKLPFWDEPICDTISYALESIGTEQALAAVAAWQADPDNFDPEAFLTKWAADHPDEE
jgi:DNA polymerase III delta prime subunit